MGSRLPRKVCLILLIPPPPKGGLAGWVGLSNMPYIEIKFFICRAFLENSGLLVKNRDYHSIREIIGDSLGRFPHNGLHDIEKGVFKA